MLPKLDVVIDQIERCIYILRNKLILQSRHSGLKVQVSGEILQKPGDSSLDRLPLFDASHDSKFAIRSWLGDRYGSDLYGRLKCYDNRLEQAEVGRSTGKIRGFKFAEGQKAEEGSDTSGDSELNSKDESSRGSKFDSGGSVECLLKTRTKLAKSGPSQPESSRGTDGVACDLHSLFAVSQLPEKRLHNATLLTEVQRTSHSQLPSLLAYCFTKASSGRQGKKSKASHSSSVRNICQKCRKVLFRIFSNDNDEYDNDDRHDDDETGEYQPTKRRKTQLHRFVCPFTEITGCVWGADKLCRLKRHFFQHLGVYQCSRCGMRRWTDESLAGYHRSLRRNCDDRRGTFRDVAPLLREIHAAFPPRATYETYQGFVARISAAETNGHLSEFESIVPCPCPISEEIEETLEQDLLLDLDDFDNPQIAQGPVQDPPVAPIPDSTSCLPLPPHAMNGPILAAFWTRLLATEAAQIIWEEVLADHSPALEAEVNILASPAAATAAPGAPALPSDAFELEMIADTQSSVGASTHVGNRRRTWSDNSIPSLEFSHVINVENNIPVYEESEDNEVSEANAIETEQYQFPELRGIYTDSIEGLNNLNPPIESEKEHNNGEGGGDLVPHYPWGAPTYGNG